MHTSQGPEAWLEFRLQSPRTCYARKVSRAWPPLWEWELRPSRPSPLKSVCQEGLAERLHESRYEEMNETAFSL